MPRRKPPKELCMEFAWLDGWLCDLKDAVERSILKAKPNVSRTDWPSYPRSSASGTGSTTG